jgi:hypothetical protein
MRWIPKCRIQLVVCSLAMLAIAGPAAMAEGSFDGAYTGKRILMSGPSDDCPAEDNVSVTINGNVLTFTDSALRNYAIGFYPSPDGTFDDIHVEVGGDVWEVQGRIVGGVLDAEVNNPPCEHHWSLEKK